MKTFLNISLAGLLLLVFCLKAEAQKQDLKAAEQSFAGKEYYKAGTLYKKAYDKASKKDKPYILFKIAECYRSINDIRNAEVYYAKAIKAGYPEPLAVLYLADMQKMQEKYADALANYQKYQNLIPSDPRGENGIKSCQLALDWKQNPTRHKVENLAQINTKDWDYSPSFADKKYKTLIFSSTRSGVTGGLQDEGPGQLFADLFTTQVDNKGKWSTPVPLPEPVNTEYNEATNVIGKKSNVMYFTRCEVKKNIDVKCQLYISVRKGMGWSDPQKIVFCVDSFNFGHPALSADESVLIFASDMPGGQGGLDLWFCSFNKQTKTWSNPQNLGPQINTQGDEEFPYLHDDGTLYFSSNGHLGMGGLDIFKAQRTGQAAWSEPANMRYPINSAGDDFGIIFEGSREKGFLTSNRAGGKGGDDIYSFNLPPVFITISGVVLDQDSKKPIKDAHVTLAGSDGSNYTISTDSTGHYKYETLNGERCVNSGYKYIVAASGMHLSFLGNPKSQVVTTGITESTDFKLDFELKKITEGELPMPLVLYNTGEWNLDHASNPKDSLEYLYSVLIENPNITIELGSHTDFRNGTQYNDTLSLKRAKSCVDYLVSKGIAADRIVPKGYGERKPLVLDHDLVLPSGKTVTKGTVLTEAFIMQFKKNKADFECLNQKNRRTVFKVLSKNYAPKQGETAPGQAPEIKLD
ncbi:MAG: OmpA family protein [Bacteroidota bacterium]